MKPQVQRQLFILVLCALFGVIFMVVQNRESALAPSTQASSGQKLFEKAREFQGRPAQATSQEPSLVSSDDCRAFYEQIETLPLESLLFDFKEKKLKIPAQCEQDTLTSQLFASLQQSCAQEKIDQSIESCQSDLFRYRARRIQIWSDGQSLQGLSSEILIQRFFGLLSSGAFAQPGGAEELRSLAAELRSRFPDSLAPARIELVSYLSDSELSDEEFAEMQRTLREARQAAPGDWQLFEIDLIQKAQNNPEAYAQTVRDFLARSPTSPIGLYHGGCVAWKQGKREEALQYFQKALAGAPGNNRFAETLQKSATSDLGASVCTATLTFHPTDF